MAFPSGSGYVLAPSGQSRRIKRTADAGGDAAHHDYDQNSSAEQFDARVAPIVRLARGSIMMGAFLQSPPHSATACRAPRSISLPGLPAFSMHTHTVADRYISAEIVSDGTWEPLETELIRRLLPSYDVFLDVGANIGWYTLVAALTMRGRGTIHAFEPDPRNFAVLEANVTLNRLNNVCLHQVAVADRCGYGQLMRDGGNMGDHRLDADLPDRGPGLSVPVTTLDALFPTPAPFLLKADTQGSEPAILSGMRGMIERQRYDVAMVLEFWPHGIVSSGRGVAAMLEPLAALDHAVLVLDEAANRLWPITIAQLAEAAKTDLAAEKGAFRNIAVLPRSVANSLPIRELRA
jgi:FkbM family methyltransferase